MPLPYERYGLEANAPFGAADYAAHVRLLDSRMTHFCCWMVNIYRGTTFGTAFRDYAMVSGKPLLIGEFGIDAYNSRVEVGESSIGEDQQEHAEGVIALVEELERHATVCVHHCARDALCSDHASPPDYCVDHYGQSCTSWECQSNRPYSWLPQESATHCRDLYCPWVNDGVCDDTGNDTRVNYCPWGTDCADCGPRDDNVASGGFLMSWVDEWWKGDLSWGPNNGRYCPDNGPDGPFVQRPCGPFKEGFNDNFLNEEWWGLLSTQQACGSRAGVDPDRLTPRTAFHELRMRWGTSGSVAFAGCSAFAAVDNRGTSLLERTAALGINASSAAACGREMATQRQRARVCAAASAAGYPFAANGLPLATWQVRLPTSSEPFQTLPNPSKPFGALPNPSEPF